MNQQDYFRLWPARAESRFSLSWVLAACLVPLFMTPGCGGGGGDGSNPTFLVSISSGSGGAVSPTSASVQGGQTASFSVTPSAGYRIDSASGCSGSMSGNTYTTGPITANCTVTVSFVEPTPEILSTLVTIDPAIPAISATTIAEVISPMSTGLLGTQIPISTGSFTRQSLILAVNSDSQIVLASIVDSQNTELSAASTALALVRIAVGELPPGIVAADFDAAIRAQPDFGHLVSIVSEALERGDVPSTNPAVLDRIGEVFREISNEPSLAGTAVGLSTQGIWDSTVPKLPFELVSDPGLSGLLSLQITGSSPGWITLSNRMPIPWVVSTFTALRDSPEQQIESRIIAPSLLGSTIVTSNTYGFNLTVGQSPESRLWMARSLMLRTVKFGLSVVAPSNCAEAALLAGLDAHVETQSDGSWGDWLAYFDAFFSAQNLATLLEDCPGPGLVSDFFKAMSPYLRALKITNGVFQGTGLAFEFTYAREFWNPPDRKFGVCVSAQGAVVSCAAEYEFIFPSGSIFVADKSCNAGLSMAPGASVTPRIIGRDAAGDLTPVPSGLIYSSDKPEVVLVDRDNGTMTANLIVDESAVVTVTDLTSSPMAEGSCTVKVVVPQVSPSSATLKIPPADPGQMSQSFKLTDHEGEPVVTPPGVIWQASPIGQQSIFPFTGLVNTNVTTWVTTDESVAGVVTVEALDPFSALPYGSATVDVVSGSDGVTLGDAAVTFCVVKVSTGQNGYYRDFTQTASDHVVNVSGGQANAQYSHETDSGPVSGRVSLEGSVQRLGTREWEFTAKSNARINKQSVRGMRAFASFECELTVNFEKPIILDIDHKARGTYSRTDRSNSTFWVVPNALGTVWVGTFDPSATTYYQSSRSFLFNSSANYIGPSTQWCVQASTGNCPHHMAVPNFVEKQSPSSPTIPAGKKVIRFALQTWLGNLNIDPGTAHYDASVENAEEVLRLRIRDGQ